MLRRVGSMPTIRTTVIEWLHTVLLISFDCHYYSRLASDGAVVLCKLGSYATVVQLAERQISNLNVAGSCPVSRSTRSPLRCTGCSEPKETYMLRHGCQE